jgi:hypothetical protein
MIYAIRRNGSFRTLIELPSRKALQPGMEAVTAYYARKWVRENKLHETALWLDEGCVRRAERDK